jgi:hypothetical protein
MLVFYFPKNTANGLQMKVRILHAVRMPDFFVAGMGKCPIK